MSMRYYTGVDIIIWLATFYQILKFNIPRVAAFCFESFLCSYMHYVLE